MQAAEEVWGFKSTEDPPPVGSKLAPNTFAFMLQTQIKKGCFSAISGVLRAILDSQTEILLDSTGQPELVRSKRGENSVTWPDIS